MYFKDLTKYKYTDKEDSLNIGWLEKGHMINKGDVPEEFIEKLWKYLRYPWPTTLSREHLRSDIGIFVRRSLVLRENIANLDEKSLLKSNFLFSGKLKAWVSRAKFPDL